MISRRHFLRRAVLGAGAVIGGHGVAPAAGPIYGWAGEEQDYIDRVTRARVRLMASPETTAQVIYQTHPMWAGGMDYFVFSMRRDGMMLPHVRQTASGLVRPLARERVGAYVVHREKPHIFFLRGRNLYRQDVLSAFQRLDRPTLITALPQYVEQVSGGLSFDANGTVLYAGFQYSNEERWGIAALDLQRNLWRIVTPFAHQVGHVQAHPSISGVILFCHETGGDAPQRMWRYIYGDTEPTPFYKEWYDEWVTHEVWWVNRESIWALNRVVFTIWPYDEEREQRMYGVVSVDAEGRDFRVHSRYKAWHVHGSPNGEYILGDDFDRNIWLIHPWTGERRLLTQGHNGTGFTTHPHASFTPDSKAVVLNSSVFGRETVVLVEIPEWESLPLAPE